MLLRQKLLPWQRQRRNRITYISCHSCEGRNLSIQPCRDRDTRLRGNRKNIGSYTLHSAFNKGEKAASDALHGANSGKLRISEPMVVAALVIGAAALHGAWRGKRHHEERSFTQQEDDRRAARRSAAGQSHELASLLTET